MMKQPSIKQFLELLRRSKILDASEFRRVLALATSKTNQENQDAASFAKELVAQGSITAWHAQKLLAWKTKGFVLGKYLLLNHLGSGGMSHVYLAQHRRVERRVAIKVLPPEKVKNDGYRDRFLREARAAAKLDHPNIVRAFDVDQQDGLHFIVMEYIEGIDLHKKVKREGPLSFVKTADYVAQAARGLHHAHLSKLVHRDVKPSNLLVTPDDLIKVLDLGLAMFDDDLGKSDELTKSNSLLGTADYLAPEQARDCHRVDHRADIYSLGCTMYYLLTGKPPFAGGTFAQRILKHQIETPESIRNHRPDCPPTLVETCERMMQKRPEDRYQSAAEVDHILTEWILLTQGEVHIETDETGSEQPATPSDSAMDLADVRLLSSTTKESETEQPALFEEADADLSDLAASLSSVSSSVVERRKRANSVKVRVPLLLWLSIGILAIVCIWLTVVAVLKNI